MKGRKKEEETSKLSQFSVALVEPQFALNVGYIARIMANFGLRRLYIVSEVKHPIDEAEASKFASHGHCFVDDLIQVHSPSELRRRFKILIGTTAIRARRKSNITRKTLEPDECISRVTKTLSRLDAASDNKRTNLACIVFGRDTTGLTNAELRLCDYSVTVRTGTSYNTLNISHAAAIIFHSFSEYLSRHPQRSDPRPRNTEKKELSSSRAEKERVVALFEELATQSDFQEYKKGKLHETLTRLLNRGDPSLREVYLLMGLASKARTKIRILSHQAR